MKKPCCAFQEVDVSKISKASPTETLELLQWLYKELSSEYLSGRSQAMQTGILEICLSGYAKRWLLFPHPDAMLVNMRRPRPNIRL